MSQFTHGGFFASREWVDFFVPRWQAMLSEPPRIPYFHVKELRDSEWRKKHGLQWEDAELRFSVTQDGREFFELVAGIPSALEAQDMVARHDRSVVRDMFKTPDLNCFLGYVLFTLKAAYDSTKGSGAAAGMVDFYLEEKKGTTKIIWPVVHVATARAMLQPTPASLRQRATGCDHHSGCAASFSAVDG